VRHAARVSLNSHPPTLLCVRLSGPSRTDLGSGAPGEGFVEDSKYPFSRHCPTSVGWTSDRHHQSWDDCAVQAHSARSVRRGAGIASRPPKTREASRGVTARLQLRAHHATPGRSRACDHCVLLSMAAERPRRANHRPMTVAVPPSHAGPSESGALVVAYRQRNDAAGRPLRMLDERSRHCLAPWPGATRPSAATADG